MPAAMTLDEFSNQLDGIDDDLLPIEFLGRAPGSFAVSAGVERGKPTACAKLSGGSSL